MSTIYKDHAIDKQELRAIKHADTICLDLNMAEGKSQLRAIREGRNSSDGYDQTVYIDCNADIDLRRGYNDVSSEYKHVKAYEYIGSCQFCDEWRTVADSLREGDIVTIDWSSDEPGNPNGGYSGNAACTLPDYRGQPLYHDTVKLVIKRTNGKRLVYRICDSHCPANSAQMIKWDGRSW